MKFQLASPHYIDDRHLEAGVVIGDDTPVPFRHAKDTKSKDAQGKPIVLKAGAPMEPSREMIPMDDEAQALFDKRFPGDVPPGDPTTPIPLQGTMSPVQVPGQAAPRPSATAPHPRPTPTPAPKTGVQAPPPGHDSSKNPGDSKDTETAKAPNINKL